MTPPDSFSRFSNLPPELRINIWEFAYASPAVLCSPMSYLTPQSPPYLLGTAPLDIGLSCSEAWRVLRQQREDDNLIVLDYDDNISPWSEFPRGKVTINIEHTVVFLGYDFFAHTWKSHHEAVCSALKQVKHIAFRWYLVHVGGQLANLHVLDVGEMFPRLRTLILQQAASHDGPILQADSASRYLGCVRASSGIVERVTPVLEEATTLAAIRRQYADGQLTIHVMRPNPPPVLMESEEESVRDKAWNTCN